MLTGPEHPYVRLSDAATHGSVSKSLIRKRYAALSNPPPHITFQRHAHLLVSLYQELVPEAKCVLSSDVELWVAEADESVRPLTSAERELVMPHAQGQPPAAPESGPDPVIVPVDDREPIVADDELASSVVAIDMADAVDDDYSHGDVMYQDDTLTIRTFTSAVDDLPRAILEQLTDGGMLLPDALEHADEHNDGEDVEEGSFEPDDVASDADILAAAVDTEHDAHQPDSHSSGDADEQNTHVLEIAGAESELESEPESEPVLAESVASSTVDPFVLDASRTFRRAIPDVDAMVQYNAYLKASQWTWFKRWIRATEQPPPRWWN